MTRRHPHAAFRASLFLILSFLLCGIPAQSEAPREGSLSITVSGFRNTTGVLRISLFDSEKGFPEDNSKALLYASLAIGKKPMKIQFKGLPYGKYAIAVLHDENKNGKLDKSFWGVPKEGIGVSNNPRPKRRAPQYAEAVFSINKKAVRQIITIQYY